MSNAGLSTTARASAATGSEVSKILEERILGTETNINLEETGKVNILELSYFFSIIEFSTLFI